jgi:hypothetical protein
LGPYEILTPIGAGGMGEVYRAKDTRLGREVAIKLSPERFSERFEREARAIASLNHPNICTLYDVGPDYLVMELVEGLTLAERITKGTVPLDESLKIAAQISKMSSSRRLNPPSNIPTPTASASARSTTAAGKRDKSFAARRITKWATRSRSPNRARCSSAT